MEFELLWKGILIGIGVSIPLGPIGMLCVQRTVNKNWRSGYISGLGAATSDSLYAIVGGFSLTMIVDFIRQHELVFGLLGVLILVILGFHIYQSNPAREIQKFKKKGTSYFQDFLLTFFLTVSNPLAVFVFIAVFASSGLVLKLSRPLEAFLIVGGVFLGASIWWLILTGTVNLFRHKMSLRVLWWANKIVGLSIMVFAVSSFLYLEFIVN